MSIFGDDKNWDNDYLRSEIKSFLESGHTIAELIQIIAYVLEEVSE